MIDFDADFDKVYKLLIQVVDDLSIGQMFGNIEKKEGNSISICNGKYTIMPGKMEVVDIGWTHRQVDVVEAWTTWMQHKGGGNCRIAADASVRGIVEDTITSVCKEHVQWWFAINP